jgi:hypothetical protein
VAWVFAGTGVALIGATIGARLVVNSAVDDRTAACHMETTPTCDDTGKSKVRTWEAVSFVTGGLALASIGVSIYLFTSSPRREPTKDAFVRVVPAPGALLLEGAF